MVFLAEREGYLAHVGVNAIDVLDVLPRSDEREHLLEGLLGLHIPRSLSRDKDHRRFRDHYFPSHISLVTYVGAWTMGLLILDQCWTCVAGAPPCRPAPY